MSGKYGGVSLIAIRDRDGAEINLGTATNYVIGRDQAMMLIRSMRGYRCIYVRDKAGHRLTTIGRPMEREF